MERGLALAAFDAMERESSPSRSGSGCQSGWTLYLDHSDGHRRVPYIDPTQKWMLPPRTDDGGDEDEEDSMASDASSGPRPSPREEDNEARRDFELHRDFFIEQRSYSSTSGRRSRASGSASFGPSTWSRSSQGGVARTAAVVFQQGEATATRQYREVIVIDDDDNDELDDTASSSAVFSCPTPLVQAR